MVWDDAASEDAEPHLHRSRSKSRRRRHEAQPASDEAAALGKPARRAHQPADDEATTAPAARSSSRRQRGEALQALAAEAASQRAPSPPSHATATRLFVADLEAVPQLAVRCVRGRATQRCAS